MKSFSQFAGELEEGVLRNGAIAAYGSKSRKHGNETVRSFKKAQQALLRGGTIVGMEKSLARIEEALYQLLDGLIDQREQIGAGVALDVVGHTLNSKALSRSR
jgi:hypothetical protein